jgi:nudix-type nucleoside diphosphatase (YffH/AdpP family)
MSRKAVIQQQRRVFDDFFKIDELTVTHEQIDGTMSAPQRRLVFERGDSVAVLLLNVDARSVVLVEQFKAPTVPARKRDDPSASDGGIVETMAGMVDEGEEPEAAAIRETREETGYEIRSPQLISTFFSSPGGTSERIFLYFAQVREADRKDKGGGIDDEDIRVVEMPLDELFDRLAARRLEDPKLIIGAYWLQDHVRSVSDRRQLVQSFWSQGAATVSTQSAAPPPASASAPGNEPLGLSTVRYAIKGLKDSFIGYKTGAIGGIKNVSIWVNSENTDMMMDRFLGKSISASIRHLGANKDEYDNVIEDTIEEALRSAVGRRAHVKIGTVLVTESGALWASHKVRRIFHVATVEGVGAGLGVRADATKLADCIDKLLKRVDEENNRFWRSWFGTEHLESILIPMLGAGDGGLTVEAVAQTIVPAAVQYFQTSDVPTLKEAYFLAYTPRHKRACEDVLEGFCRDGILERPGEH